ncbi:GNAT family N-acetyltransferase [Cytobacillus kochii]|uniref:GNAT family N-acetyltransferase n=1 Tax=Cytobacillus kochii TaxID=859143 RepID=UPI001CD735E2|nr:GNAT family N-acetyltransferase [Cytobacillus kochii]MCA1026218.1 GNAT family N-acetyltransferase [Cytobacillus kochii]
MLTGLAIKKLTTIEEMETIQKLERDVWGMDPIPIHQTATAIKNGGLMLGAFDENELIGFSYGFPGYANGEAFLCSHMLGIHQSYRDKGIGALLKVAQREAAEEMGYNLIRWTFDPLQSRNAYLNLSKLNGICNDYLVNCYGEMVDGINKGLPSDRFNIEWRISSSHVKQQLNYDVTPIYPFEVFNRNDFPAISDMEQTLQTIDYNEMSIAVPIPAEFMEIKKHNPSLAKEWREVTRRIFQQLFQHGYTAYDVQKNNHVSYIITIKRQKLQLDVRRRNQ